MPTSRRRPARRADADTTTCKTEDCGHPRSEHALDAKSCYHDEREEDSAGQPQLTCPCTGFSATTEEAAFREVGHATNADLPDTGPVIASELHDEDGDKELASVGAGEGGSGEGGAGEGSAS